ncbi:unnamed protein product [Rhizophagus irregularis]|nr:unnamed protein product [Rhizophagus irregularis]
MPNKEIFIGYTFFRSEKVKRYTGADTIYSTRKRKSYILLHMDSLQKEKDMLTIVTNNRHIIKKYERPFLINSDRPMMNTKYRISKYLTSVFCGLPIDIETRNKYFLRIRQLLLDKLVVIENRLKNKKRTDKLQLILNLVMADEHGIWGSISYAHSVVIVTPTPPPQNVFKDFSKVKQVISKHVGVSYTKKVLMDGGARKYAVTYSNLQINKHDILKKQYISEKEMEFLVDQVTSEVGYKMLIGDIFINHSFNEEHFFELRKKKDASFERKDSKLAEQSSSAGQSTTIDNIITDLQEMEISGQNNVAPWQEIFNRREPITRAEFHWSLNGIRDKSLLMTYCNGVRRGRREHGVTHDYMVNQCAIKARKLEQGMLY